MVPTAGRVTQQSLNTASVEIVGDLNFGTVHDAVSQNWQIWVGNDTLWILFFNSFHQSSLWIFTLIH